MTRRQYFEIFTTMAGGLYWRFTYGRFSLKRATRGDCQPSWGNFDISSLIYHLFLSLNRLLLKINQCNVMP
jgi:hypothetical protein